MLINMKSTSQRFEAHMGRHRVRVDPHEPLPQGLYRAGRQYRARHPGGKWTYFGADYLTALAGFRAWRVAVSDTKTTAWLLDAFTGDVCPSRVRAGTLAPRTARDYQRDVAMLRKAIGHIPLAALLPRHIADFRNARAEDAPAHVRNELACLSAALAWAVEAGHVTQNVCREIRRPRKHVRDRLVTDAEYICVYAQAGPSVRLAMALAIRTLGLPADVLRMGARNVVAYENGRQTLRFRRGKTHVPVEVEIIGELAAVLKPLLAAPTLHPTFVRREDGKPYTVNGIGAMFRRCCAKAGVRDFGLRDLRAKGATDMFRADPDSIREIQLLLGHKSVRTTEVYLKDLLAEIVQPNQRPIVAAIAK